MWPKDLNYLAVLVSAAAMFFLGHLWYVILFGKAWLAAQGKTREQIQAEAAGAGPFITAGVTALVEAAVLAIVLRVTGTDATLAQALQMATLLWLGFAIGTAAKHYAFKGARAKLLVIDYAYDRVGLLIMATTLTLWK